MKEQGSVSDPISPDGYLEKCRKLASGASVRSIYLLWPDAEQRAEDLKRTLDFDEAVRYLTVHSGGILEVQFNWDADGRSGRAEVEFVNASFPLATDKFIWQMISSLITAKIADELFRDKYPDPEWLQ